MIFLCCLGDSRQFKGNDFFIREDKMTRLIGLVHSIREIFRKYSVLGILGSPFRIPPLVPVTIRRCSRYSLFLLLLVVLGGCSHHPPVSVRAGGDVLRFAYQANSAASAQQVPEYQIGYNDLLEVKFFNNNQFNETARVRPDGRISLQKVGDLFVVGKTPAQVRDTIRVVYSRILKNPEVTVIVREFGGVKFYVLGAVKNPGGYEYAKNMTLLQAIAAAGGTEQGARMNSVFLIRKQKDGYFYVHRLNLSLGDMKQAVQENIAVEPYDLIYVPKTSFRKSVEFLKQVWDGYLAPVDLYLRTIFFYKRF